MWPVWERLAAAHPLPPGFEAIRVGSGAPRSGDRLVMSVGEIAGGRAVDRIALAPVGQLRDLGTAASLEDIRAGRFRVQPLESITLPDIALPVGDMYPDQAGYPLFTDVSLDLQGGNPALQAWLDSLPPPAPPAPPAITWVGAVGDLMPARGVDAVLLRAGGARRVFGDTLPILGAAPARESRGSGYLGGHGREKDVPFPFRSRGPGAFEGGGLRLPFGGEQSFVRLRGNGLPRHPRGSLPLGDRDLGSGPRRAGGGAGVRDTVRVDGDQGPVIRRLPGRPHRVRRPKDRAGRRRTVRHPVARRCRAGIGRPRFR